MSLKYRIRLANDRVIGPFDLEEIGELYSKEHIDGTELCQQFPIGNWRTIDTFPEIQIHLAKLKRETKEATKVTEIIKDKTRSKLEEFNEFKFGKDINIDVNYDELEKKYKEGHPEDDNEDQKTRVAKRNKARLNPDVDKTVVIPSKAKIPIKENKESKKELRGNGNESELPPVPVGPTEEELIKEKTEVVSLASILPTINAQLSVSEVELDQKARIEENKEKVRLKEQRTKLAQKESENEDFDEFPAEESAPKKKKGMSLIVALAFLGIFYVLLTPDEKPKISGPLYLEVKFPITQEFEDKVAATVALNNGRNLYAKNNYINRSLASNQYLLSLQKKFDSNEALGEIILTYSELMDDTREPKKASNTIYKLIQLAENKMLTDLNVVTGTALFYDKIGKYQTGVNIVKNYFRTKAPISSKLLAYYLDLLINSGDLVEARKVYTKLKDTPKKPFESYYYLARFNEVDDQLAEAQSTIEEGLKYFPNSTLLLLKESEYLFKARAQKKFEEVLAKCQLNNSEGSPSYTSKYLQQMGLLSALKGKNKEASAYFKKSLDLKESDELRAMLSSLEISGDKLSQSLILESKVIDLIKKAKAEIKNKNLEAAFSFSIEASDAAPDYVPAILLQTQLQIKRGLFDAAISNLSRAITLYPTNHILKKHLIATYIKAYKFEDAQKVLVILSQTKFAFTGEYASLMGDFYQASNNIPLAVRWYSEALNRDPLSDYDLFQLSKIYVRIKNFKDAKVRLSKALLLDPKNPEYLALNAEILFEQDNTDTAIGYLRDAISEIGEDPKLISTITTFYYKSGQIKEFQNNYKHVQELPKKDEGFYEFLLYASKLEEKNDDYINYSHELLKLNPGNLKVRLELGEFLYEQKKYPEAIAEFEEVRSKLTSYPKVHFMLAKVYLASGDIKKAKAMALKEMELNPGLDSAYYIVGEVARMEKDYQEAVLKYEKAIGLNPKSVDALMALGSIRLSQNYASEAIELLNKALKEDKNNPEIHKLMGFAYKAAGQRALAKEKLEDYLKLSPGAVDREQIEGQIRNLQ